MNSKSFSIRDKLAKNCINALGWHTKKHYLLIESDDWGAIRMPSRTVYEQLCAAGAGEGSFFDKYDSLESPNDLEPLFEVLSMTRDINGHGAIMQPFFVVANPDYDTIEANGFTEYVYEGIEATYKRYSHTRETFDVVKEGVRSGLWHPQSHGREHIQVKRWMSALQRFDLVKQEFFLRAFHGGCAPPQIDYYSAFDYDEADDLPFLGGILSDGLELFERLFGYKSISFCAPCGYTTKEFVSLLSTESIRLRSGQYTIRQSNGSCRKINDFWGHKDTNGVIVYRRNCKFEPSKNHYIDWVDRCLYEIDTAFRWGKPAVIDSHRVNYIGSISIENRDFTLRELTRLLREVIKKWPDVEFVDSETLYNEMIK